MGQALIMGHQDQGRAVFLVEFEQQVADAFAGMAVKVAGGFVGEQYLRFCGKSPGNGYALLLSAGKLAGEWFRR